ncbi:MAG: hypothetical protein K9I59_07015 [Chlorobium sp.]|jgi:hypothetical protein|uniref:hypothetical protein n=1 Tax=Chlorobium sp. TaxID=1095 RepID=UPI001D30F353|nr:hypothetical protein [Chlorobium sp.]MBN1279461.1 hypothetical protein [Chlorobiaceae bacterium]MCF8216516.1 hypothetical protein [Chlorobium sp.]MCF8271421.1 hypothetical protein [Chlorobium sp.]MCF8287793.1 hypothetical protein [Chlorobium sp.]MCF8291332.1 hypothetical protein [Chlorobium sp.]
MFIDFAIMVRLLVVLAGSDPQQLDESRCGDTALLRPVPDEVDDGITGNPGFG